jgi:TM2 domain-containing membrane protein YozV
MQISGPIYTADMNDHQRAWFYAEYERARKDEVIGILLAFFLGCFGIHHFYLRRNDLGIIYLLLSWTGIPAILGVVECFFMPGRVRRFNTAQAIYISGQIRGHVSDVTRCSSCGSPVNTLAVFCHRCGAATTSAPLNAHPAV